MVGSESDGSFFFFREPCHLPSHWSISSHSLPNVYIQRQTQQSIRGNLWLLKIQVPPSSTQAWHLSGAEISFGFCPHLFLSLRVCLCSHSLCLTSSRFYSLFLTTSQHLFSSPFLPLTTSAFTCLFSLYLSSLAPLSSSPYMDCNWVVQWVISESSELHSTVCSDPQNIPVFFFETSDVPLFHFIQVLWAGI